MKILIIIGIIILLLIIFFSYLKYRTRNIINNSNPIDSITQKGTLGFYIGDSDSTVISRIKKLHLATEEDIIHFKQKKMLFGSNNGIYIARNMFNHIEHIMLWFEENKLKYITIYFIERDQEAKELINTIAHIFWKKFGACTESYIGEDATVLVWFDGIICLNYFTKNIITNKPDFHLRIGKAI